MKNFLHVLGIVSIMLPTLSFRVSPEERFQEYTRLPGGFLAWGDYDQDGDLDMITGCSHSDRNAHIIQNEPLGSFNEVQTLPCGHNIQAGSQPWADYDRDGDLDLALPARDAAYLYRNDDGRFVEDERIDFPEQFSGGAWFQWGDIDQINGPDLVISGTNYSGLYLNDGTGDLTKAQDLPRRDNHSGDLGDFDNDGDLDLAVIGATPGGGGPHHFEVYLNTGGSFDRALTLGSRGGDVHWVDVNMDDLLDLFIAGAASQTDNHVEIWIQDPVNTFTRDPAQSGLDELAAMGLRTRNYGLSAWGDYDGDRDPDLFISGPIPGGCLTLTYHNEPTGHLVEDTETGLNGLPICYYYPSFGDFDRDNDLDLAVWEENGDVIIFTNGLTSAPVSNVEFCNIATSTELPGLNDPFSFSIDLMDDLQIPLSLEPINITLTAPDGEMFTYEGTTTQSGRFELPQTFTLEQPGPYLYNLSIEGVGDLDFPILVPGSAAEFDYEAYFLSAAKQGGFAVDEIDIFPLPLGDVDQTAWTYIGETTYVPAIGTGKLHPAFDLTIPEEYQLRMYAHQCDNYGMYTSVPCDTDQYARGRALIEEDIDETVADFVDKLDTGLTIIVFAREAAFCISGITATGVTGGLAAPVGYATCAPLVIHLTAEAAQWWLEREYENDRMDYETYSMLHGTAGIASTSIRYIIAPETSAAMEGLRAAGFAADYLAGSSEMIYGIDADGTVLANYAGTSVEIIELAADVSDFTSVLSITARSPVQLEIVDPAGNRLSFDPEIGRIVSEIDGAAMTLPGMVPQRAWIPNPIDGDYEVILNGTDSGYYDLVIATLNRGERPQVETFQGIVSEGDRVNYQTSITLDDQYAVRSVSVKVVSQTGREDGIDLFGWKPPIWILVAGLALICGGAFVLIIGGAAFVILRKRKTG